MGPAEWDRFPGLQKTQNGGSEEQASFDGFSASYSINSYLNETGTIPGREVEKFRDEK